MNNDNAYNNVLDSLLSEAAMAAANELGSEILVPDCDIEYSPKHRRAMARLLSGANKKPLPQRVFKAAACFLLVLFVGSAGLVVGVKAVRTKLLNFILDEGAPGTEYSYNVEPKGTYTGELVELVYVPAGFECTGNHINFRTGYEVLDFTNGDDLWFSLSFHDASEERTVDTEGAEIEYTEISGYDAVFISKSTRNAVIWSDGENAYDVYGNISKKDILKIAANIKLR